LHESARRQGYNHILEISTKSLDELGVSLSAFNLSAKTKKKGYEFTVERAFQSSKVFEHEGPYIDLMAKISREAKKDVRLKTSGLLLRFEFCGKEFPRNPPTYFYDWLYINTLLENPALIEEVKDYNIFSDIEFNHEKSINCQAYSIALFKSMLNCGQDTSVLKIPETFLKITSNEYSKKSKMLQRFANYKSELFS